MLKIQQVTSIASIQDQGRLGFGKFGISSSGAMDKFAVEVGNTILLNNPIMAAIELVIGGITIEFTTNSNFIITGGYVDAELNKSKCYSYSIYPVKAGDVLKINRVVRGMYAYICVSGGIQVDPILNSRSTDAKSNFGGYHGRNLEVGDNLPIAQNVRPLTKISIAPIPYRETIRIVRSSEFEKLTRKSRFKLVDSDWRITSESNRMGTRIFNSKNLKFEEQIEMLSHAVHPGIIQLPPSGQPIILTSGCQVTGGYPKIASIIDSDIGSFVQLRFGKYFKFEFTSLEEAQLAYKQQLAYLYQINLIAQSKHPSY